MSCAALIGDSRITGNNLSMKSKDIYAPRLKIKAERNNQKSASAPCGIV